jgi:hypothetical protein
LINHDIADVFRRIIDTNKNLEETIYKSAEDVELSNKEVEMWKKAYLKEQQKSEKAEDDAKMLRKQLADVEGAKVRQISDDPMVLAKHDLYSRTGIPWC